MAKKSTQKTMLGIMFFAGLLTVALMLDNLFLPLPSHVAFLNPFKFAISVCIYIGLYSYWTISIYRRIMQRHVRNYLILIGININIWITIRAIKWTAFEFVVFEDRILWYMYYIPMIMLSVLFLFISLYVGESEEYLPDKKWNLLYIPALLIIVAVLTNDIHGLAFTIDTTLHAFGRDYSHGPVYFLALFFILSMVLVSSFIILHKFSFSKNVKKKALLPTLVIVMCLIYSVLYIIKPNYGIGHILDLTVFGCTMAIALLESFIRTGLIHSNMGHSDCFAMANIRAQILNTEGTVVYISENASPITNADFKMLIKHRTASFNSSTLSHIMPIRGGYVAWNSDVSQIKHLIKKLKTLNSKLYKEVALLTLENEQKSEKARLQKLNDLHNIMLKEVLPLSEKIKYEIELSGKTDTDDFKRLLFETSMTSIYIKRKVNLILTQQTEKWIYADDMRYCFLESFQLLKFYDKVCAINIINTGNISLGAAMASFDLYQNVIERTNYNFDAIYVTYNFDEDNMMFALQISGDINLCYNDITPDIIDNKKGVLKLLDETDSYYISLVMPKQ